MHSSKGLRCGFGFWIRGKMWKLEIQHTIAVNRNYFNMYRRFVYVNIIVNWGLNKLLQWFLWQLRAQTDILLTLTQKNFAIFDLHVVFFHHILRFCLFKIKGIEIPIVSNAECQQALSIYEDNITEKNDVRMLIKIQI